MKTILIAPLLFMIKLYQKLISPFFPSSCRFQPTCSHYTKEALLSHGFFKGSYLGVKRILRCQPWGGSGFDPVPKKIELYLIRLC
jgi:hypothetical protein